MNQPGMARVRPSKLFHQMRAGLSFAWLEAGVAQPRSIPAMSQEEMSKLLGESVKQELLRRVERDALEAREEVSRVVESTLRQMPPQLRHLPARQALELLASDFSILGSAASFFHSAREAQA
ncbi:unnamed protein product [Effrenium voratum]|nr:unnamed protein product [Effrenium voratum]CAJ1429065.1 unnamed protein product [Effrenium voratum]